MAWCNNAIIGLSNESSENKILTLTLTHTQTRHWFLTTVCTLEGVSRNEYLLHENNLRNHTNLFDEQLKSHEPDVNMCFNIYHHCLLVGWSQYKCKQICKEFQEWDIVTRQFGLGVWTTYLSPQKCDMTIKSHVLPVWDT